LATTMSVSRASSDTVTVAGTVKSRTGLSS
jgi:hypothetical protein